MALKVDGRSYDTSDLEELMDNTYDWAKDWNDILWYIKNVADYDADFARKEIEPLYEDVSRVRGEGKLFTYDYRELYQYITGQPCDGCKPGGGLKSHGIDPKKIVYQYLKGLSFPATKEEVIRMAQKNNTPENVINLLQQVKSDSFPTFGVLIENIGDLTWDHD